MGLVKGGFQRLIQTILYGLCFCCAGIILGVYSYFLSVLADRNDPIANWKKAVEGISGAAVVYTLFAIVLTCCLGGISFFAFLALVLDVLFAAGMIAIAVMARDGAGSCSGNVQTPLGNGNPNSGGSFGGNGIGTGDNQNLTYSASLYTACRLNTAAFAVAILGAFLFLCTAVMQILLVRHHKKEKRYGPSPSNNYTSGYGSKQRFGFGRKKKNTANEAEMGAVGRPSHETHMTGTTVGNGVGTQPYDKTDGATPEHGVTNGTTYGNHAPHGAHGGYYTQPTGTGAQNPYGYPATGTATNY